jgi:diguanylate cyclase (GGDEF)-like protein/PAS domain S-box-containing protein
MADSSAPAGTAARLAELARRVAVSLDLQATLQLVADAVVEDLSFRAVAVNIERPGGMYEVVAVAGPDDVKGLLGQVAPGNAYLEILDASEAWGDLRFYSHLNQYPDDLPSWVSPALESAEGPGAWHPLDTLLAPLHAPDGTLIGMLSVDGPEGGQLPGPARCELLGQFAVHAALAIEHARVHTMLASSEQLFRAMFDHSPIAVALLSDDWHMVRVNAALERLLGRTAGELTGCQTPEFASLAAPPRGQAGGPPGTQEIHFTRPDGSEVRGRVNMTRLPGDPVRGPGQILTQIEDITQLRAAQARLAHAATHDRLTGLPDRSLVMDRIAAALNGSRAGDGQLAVLFCDLDHFKEINDTLGHAAGDQLLIEVAGRLQASVRETDTVGRLGGDEFVVVARQVPGGPGLAAFVSRMMAAVCQPAELGGTTVVPAMSAGVALAAVADDPSTLLAAADGALYQVKNSGRGRWQLARR